MGKSNTYSSVKGRFVQDRMKEGRTNEEARKDWSKSDQKANFDHTEANRYNPNAHYDPIDRSHDSPMQDWADTEEDW